MAKVKQWNSQKGFWANVIEIVGLLSLVFIIRTIGFGLYQVPTGSMETSMLVGERFFADKFSYLFRDPKKGEVIAFNEPPQVYNYSKNKFMNLFQHYVWGPSNWTKRIIGVPGDEIRGVIEDGKPVIYVNGVKLDEPYLNKYPLIHVWREDPIKIQREAQRQYQTLLLSGVDRATAEAIINQELHHNIAVKSYDPNISFQDQPFYRINPKLIDRNEDGSLNLRWPGTPVYSKRIDARVTTNHNYWDGSDEFYVKLGPDEYWLMGDNRQGSKDSRYFGPIKKNFIHGRILFRIWSLDSDYNWWIFDLLQHPIDFWSRMRWNRFFQWIY
jgi:signal peptidase I